MKFVKLIKKYVNILLGKGKPSRKLIRAAEGSVTIFLLVIMFPMLVFSFSVVDICKIFMAKDSLEGATDIALRSAMTAYDDILKDMYGIFATSKSDDELKNDVLKYYEATLSSCGVNDKEASATMSFIQSLFDTGVDADMNNNENFLKVFPGATIDGEQKAALSLSGVKESAASNPTVLHRQIVDYMKYRGPVVMTAGLFEKINAFNDISNQTNTANLRLDYERTAAKLNNNAIMAYTLLKMYEDNNKVLEGGESTIGSLPYVEEKYKTGLIDKGKYAYSSDFPLKGIKSKSPAESAIESSVEEHRIVSNYILTIRDYLPGYLKSNKLSLYDYNSTGNLEDAYEQITSNPSYSDMYIAIKNDKVSDYLEELSKVCVESPADIDKANIAFNILVNFAPLFEAPSGKQPEDTAFSKELKIFIRYYEENEDDDDTPPNEEHEELYDQITTAENAVKKYVETTYSDAEQRFNTASSTLNMMYDAMIKQINIIDILTGESEIPYKVFGFSVGKGICLEDIYKLFDDAKKDAKQWGDSIGDIQTATQKNSNEAQFKSETTGLAELDHSDVEAMINALKSQREIYKKVANDTLESIVFLNNIGIIDAAKEKDEHRRYTTLKDCVEKMPNDFSVSSAYSIESVASDAFVSFTPFDGSKFKWSAWNQLASEVTNNGKNEFYQQLKKLSTPAQNDDDKTAEAKKSNGKEIQSKIKDKGKVDENGKPTSSTGKSENPPQKDTSDSDYLKNILLFRNYYNKDDTPPAGAAGEFQAQSMSDDNDKLAGNTQTLMKEMGGYFQNLGKSLGESVLITEYINKQFSCYTTNMDGKGGRTVEETMLTGMSFYDIKNQKANVVWYGAEQEYILYGNDDKDANLAAAFASIFAVRFVLNLIYSYTDEEIRNFTWSVASAIGGVFPLSIPLVQTVLHIALSMAESTYDMVLLRGGAEVPLYKTTTTWVCKGSNIVRNIAADVIDAVAEKAIDEASDKLAKAINEAIGKAGEEGIDFVNSKIDGFDELVNSELEKLKLQIQMDIITPLESAVQQAMATYNGSKAEFREQLVTLIDDIYTNSDPEKNIYTTLGLNNIEPGNYLKEAEKSVLDHFFSNKDQYIKVITDNVENYLSLATSVVADDFDADTYDGFGKFAETFNSDMSDLFNSVEEAVKGVTGNVKSALSDSLNEIVKKAQDGVNKGVEIGADYVKEKVGEFSNKIRGQGHLDQNISYDAKKNTSSTINMSYKDYLNIFMIIAVASGDTNQLERAGKLMTANVRKKSGDMSYDLNTAHTVIKAESSATVRTVFFGSVLEDGSFKLSGNPNKYSFDYTTYLGY